MRLQVAPAFQVSIKFPFLFGGTFIEALKELKGLVPCGGFPFLFGGTFIEARVSPALIDSGFVFPFLFGGTFIEATDGLLFTEDHAEDFPSFSEGLSLRLLG